MSADGPAAGAASSLPKGVKSDIRSLASIVRDSAGDGEREAATHVAARLRKAGVPEVGLREFRGRTSYAAAHGAHTAAGLVLSLLRGPFARVGSLLLLGSLELDASGRMSWIDRFLPAGTGTNVIGRVPPKGGGEPDATLVIVAHHDAARTGLVWHPALAKASRSRRLRTRRVDGFMVPVAVGFLLAAMPSRIARRIGTGLLAVATAAVADVARGETVPGASDNASGVAAMVSLAREVAAEPFESTQVMFWSVGCEESGMDGMKAALKEFDPAGRVLFLGLDTLGAGSPIVAAEEGTILGHRYGDAELDLVDRAADRAGLERPQRWRIGGWTDPIVARFSGFPAVSLLSMGPDGNFTDYHLPSDTPDRVDLDSVADCISLARAVASEFDRSGAGSA